MQVELTINREQAIAAAQVIIDLIVSQPLDEHGRRAQMLPDAAQKAINALPNSALLKDCAIAALDSLACLTWEDMRSNMTYVWRNKTESTYILYAEASRQALNANEGVGLVFRAAFGDDLSLAPQAHVTFHIDDECDAPWWQCDVDKGRPIWKDSSR